MKTHMNMTEVEYCTPDEFLQFFGEVDWAMEKLEEAAYEGAILQVEFRCDLAGSEAVLELNVVH